MFFACSAVLAPMPETKNPRSSISVGAVFQTFVSANFCRLRSRRKVWLPFSILKALCKFLKVQIFCVSGVYCPFLQFL